VTVRARAEHVLLVSMPFGALERPALSLGLLKAHCARLGVPCDVWYATFAYADLVGVEEYLWLCSDDVPYTAFAGDWVFAEAVHGPRPEADTAYVERVLRKTWRTPEADLHRLRRLRSRVEPFLRQCLEQVPWEQYTLLGFTSVFQQNLASLALAQRVKAAHPHLTIAMGGANWEDVMGPALQRAFPFVDLAFSGEADESFPAVLTARRVGDDVAAVPGVTVAGAATRAAPAARVASLDTVPVPDYDDWFEQKARSGAAAVGATLLVETARGCWWGERSHCTFCGLNGATMTFRSKTPSRVVDELSHLSRRHGTSMVSVVDDILDQRFFRDVLPELADRRLGLDIFWEVKANLTRDQVRILRAAGVTMIQPGLESLSNHVLDLMRKGTTTFRNVQLLKWCQELGVQPYWNLLYGFPGETAADYAEIAATIRAIWHLDPPVACGPIRMDRFSPYHGDPAAYGMTGLRPMEPFEYLYPVPDAALADIAYYFEFDYTDGRSPEEFAHDVIALAASWKSSRTRGALELSTGPGERLQVLDTREDFRRKPRRALLDGWKAEVYLRCDTGASLDRLRELPAVRAAGVGDDDVREFLDRCVEHRLAITTGTSWLAVATWRTGADREHWMPASTTRGSERRLPLLMSS
jgi:ribosomal peptide maturation radical SAM protein 1